VASSARSKIDAIRPLQPPPDSSVRNAEEELLSEVMISVSASLEKMTEEEREKAVNAAERSVSHLR
jgi:hypothetical protein